MVSTHFEGPEGQIAEMDGRGRSPSALGRRLTRKGRSDSNLIGRSGLDQRAFGGITGRDISMFETGAASKALLETLSQKHDEGKSQPKKHYLPRLVLRPVDPPEGGEPAKGESRPGVRSMPNSYRLDSRDVDPAIANCASCRAALSSMDLGREAMLKALPTTATANTLPDMIPLLSPTPSIHGSQTASSDVEALSSSSVPTARSRSSSVSTGSRGITYHAFLKRSPSASDIGLPLPPVLSQNTAHYRYSTKRLSLDLPLARPKTVIEHKPLTSPFPGLGSGSSPRASFESGKTFIDVLKISAGSVVRSGSADGDLAENKTLSDYSSKPTAEEESVDLNGVSTHAAISYEKLIVRPTLGEGSTTILTVPLETESPESSGNSTRTEGYVISTGNVSNVPQIMVNSLVQSPVSLNSNLGGPVRKQQLPKDPKGVDLGWSTPMQQSTNAGAKRILGSSGSSDSYTDSDESSVGSITESDPRPPQGLSRGITFQNSAARKYRRYSSSDAVEAAPTAKLSSFRSYSQGTSRKASVRPGYPGDLKAEAGGLSPTQWIRQLLRRRTTGSRPGSPPNLTARPPRRLRTTPLPGVSTGITDSSPAHDSCEGDNMTTGHGSGSRDGQVSETGTQFQRDTSDRFNKMILELEVLLNEALHIAKEASERQITQQLPQILQDATAQLGREATSGTPSTGLSRKYLIQSPIAMDSKSPSVSSIPTKSRKQSIFTQNRSRSQSNVLISSGSPRRTNSAIPSPVSRRGTEAKTERLDSRISIIEPPSPEHTPSTRKSTADYLATPYPNASAAASETSLVDATEKLVSPSDYHAALEPVETSPPCDGSNATSASNEWLPALRQGSQQHIRRSETGILSNGSYQYTPPRFYGGEEQNPHQGPGQNLDSPHPINEVSRSQHATPQKPYVVRSPLKEAVGLVIRDNRTTPNFPSRDDIRRHIKQYNSPPIQPRHSSSGLRQSADPRNGGAASHGTVGFSSRKRRRPSGHVLGGHHEYPSYSNPTGGTPSGDGQRGEVGGSGEGGIARKFSLSSRRHISLRGGRHFSLRRSHRRQPISRDWSTMKKRFTAAVSCISTALVGVIVGVYVCGFLLQEIERRR
ncbi:MAG: hypothetical protein M1839_008262 [Geoglossum umbratile]|nr:MAG: hypothetical protein M1839_008262 [Geoglossum umbratile]